MHTLNDQVFRGFFTGRYLFDSVTGLPALRLAGGGRRLRARHGRLLRRHLRDRPGRLPGGRDHRPADRLLLYLQGAGRTGPATDAAGASNITNDELSLFAQDQWQSATEPDPQLRPALGRPADAGDGRSAHDRVWRRSSNDPAFPSDGTIPDQWAMFQPRVGVAWDIRATARSVLRGSAGIYSARQNMLSARSARSRPTACSSRRSSPTPPTSRFRRADAGVAGRADAERRSPEGQFPLFSGVRVFDRDYKNPRIYSFNVALRAGTRAGLVRLRRFHLERRP